MREALKKIVGPIGLVLILVGGVTYGILFRSGPLAMLPLLAGLVLTASAIIIRLREAQDEGYRRTARFSLSAGLSVLFLTAILVFLQTLSVRHNSRLDTTLNRRFSLSTQTTKILDGLDSDVLFTCFYKETTVGKQELDDLLYEYSNRTPRISYRFVDPDKDPVIASRYEEPGYGMIVVESGKLDERIAAPTEEMITNALLKVTRQERKVLYFITGHGERSLQDKEERGLSELRSSIEAENYAVKELFTLRLDEMPKDCEIIVIAGPRKDIFPEERELIDAYLAAGGNALFLLEPVVEIPEITTTLTGYGIEPGNDIIIDRFGRVLAGNYLTPIVNSYGDHPITKGFRFATFFPRSRSIRPLGTPPDGVVRRMIARTGSSAYAETDIDTLIEIGKTQYEGDKDQAGPIYLCAVSTRDLSLPQSKEKPDSSQTIFSRIAVFGDSDFTSNAYLKISGNLDLIMNTINWLAEEEDLIAIRPADPLSQLVILSSRQGAVVFWLPVVGLPSLVALLGVMVSIRKRRSA
ncbi:MAG: GldG family protein [bacterium]|nr:MAG: GldG family protein [bacterium]